jgi:hypothetical protein
MNGEKSVCFSYLILRLKVREGVKEKLRAIPDWQERLRDLIDELIENTGDSCR